MYKGFRKGREDVEDDARPGRPSTSITDENVEKIKAIMLANRRITIRDVAGGIGILYGSCEAIFTNVFEHKTHGFFTMTTHHHTPRYSSNSSWQKTKPL